MAAAYRLGANGFLVKPAQASKCVDMAKAIKDFWLTHNQFPKEPQVPLAAHCRTRTRTTPFPLKPALPGNWVAIKSHTIAIQNK